MVATACIGCRGRTTRGWWIVRVVDVLVIAVDNRGKAISAGSRVQVRRNPEIVIQVAVAGTGDAAFADTTLVNNWSCLNLREATARSSCAQVLRHVYVPLRARRIVIGRAIWVVIRSTVIDDIDMTSAIGYSPGEDGCVSRCAVHPGNRRPVLTLIGREAV